MGLYTRKITNSQPASKVVVYGQWEALTADTHSYVHVTKIYVVCMTINFEDELQL